MGTCNGAGLRAACAVARIRLLARTTCRTGRIVMRPTPYKPRLPGDRKLWPPPLLLSFYPIYRENAIPTLLSSPLLISRVPLVVSSGFRRFGRTSSIGRRNEFSSRREIFLSITAFETMQLIFGLIFLKYEYRY